MNDFIQYRSATRAVHLSCIEFRIMCEENGYLRYLASWVIVDPVRNSSDIVKCENRNKQKSENKCKLDSQFS